MCQILKNNRGMRLLRERKFLIGGFFLKLILLCVFVPGLNADALMAQGKFSKEEKAKLKEANFYFKITDYMSALALYKELFSVDSLSPDINFKMGICLFKAGEEKKSAIGFLKKSYDAGYRLSGFYLAQCYHLENRFDDAIDLYRKFLSGKGKTEIDTMEVNRLMDISIRAKEMIRNPVDVKIENLGSTINSQFPEYVPLVNADESVLIFTSRRIGSTGGLLDPYNRFFEDVYISRKINGQWTFPEGISPVINSNTHDACVGLSSDGATMIIFRTSEDMRSGDLYLTILEGENWVIPQLIGDFINSEYNEPSACMSEDGKTIYFSSDRPGGHGGKDIYRVVRFNNGDWSLPQNAGPIINSPQDDDAPFLHPDGVTMYFSSKGHKTMGGYDIFKSVLDPDAETEYIGQPPKWSEPANMGFPINSSDDDLYFVLSTSGERGYYSSEKPAGYGGQDIYVLQMPGTEAKSLVILKGSVLGDGDEPLRALITLSDDGNGEVEGIYNSNSKTGKFLMIVSLGKKYTMMVSAEGYKSYSESFDFSTEELVKEIVVPIKLDKE